jgi:hypothetical protein
VDGNDLQPANSGGGAESGAPQSPATSDAELDEIVATLPRLSADERATILLAIRKASILKEASQNQSPEDG